MDAAQQQQKELEQGRSFFPQDVTRFLELLQAQRIPFHLIADCVDILDPRWLHAVEGVLGSERFTLIIEDGHQRLQAKRLGQQYQYRYWISHPKYQRTDDVPHQSLRNVVAVTEPSVAGWVQDRLASIRRVESIEEGDALSRDAGLVTITPLAYLQERRGGRSVAPFHLVCGGASRLARLQELVSELHHLRPLVEEAHTCVDSLQHEVTRTREHLQRAQTQQALPEKELVFAVVQERCEEARTQEQEAHE